MNRIIGFSAVWNVRLRGIYVSGGQGRPPLLTKSLPLEGKVGLRSKLG